MTPAVAASSVGEAVHDQIVPRIGHTFSTVLYGAAVRGVTHEMRGAIERLPYVASVHLDQKVAIFGATPARFAPAASSGSAQVVGGGAGVVVAVIDTGIDYRHPALGGGIGSGFKVIGGWDFGENDADPLDENGHGTHVAGIIAANGGGLTGVAPGASLLAFKVTDASGGSTASLLIAAIERALDPNGDGDPSDRSHVVNISMGGLAQKNDPIAAAVERATAAGILFTISNGNEGLLGFGALPSPALASSAISVGASGVNDRVASFSSRGPNYDYSIKPEVVAPGVDILSSIPGNKTVHASGTSMAAPYVAGVAALIKAAHPQWSPAEIKAAIVSTSVPLPEDVMIAGAGRVSAERAAAAGTIALPAIVDFGHRLAAAGLDGLADVHAAQRHRGRADADVRGDGLARWDHGAGQSLDGRPGGRGVEDDHR